MYCVCRKKIIVDFVIFYFFIKCLEYIFYKQYIFKKEDDLLHPSSKLKSSSSSLTLSTSFFVVVVVVVSCLSLALLDGRCKDGGKSMYTDDDIE